MSAETNVQPTLVEQIEACTSRLIDEFNDSQVPLDIMKAALDSLCMASLVLQTHSVREAETMMTLGSRLPEEGVGRNAYLTSGEVVTMENMAKLRDAAQEMRSADTITVDPNWVE